MSDVENSPQSQRLNISLSGRNVVSDAEELRARLEKRLKQRLAMSQVIKRLIKMALEEEIKASS